MAKIKGKWVEKDSNSLTVAVDGSLKVKLQDAGQSLLDSTADGIRIVPGSVVVPSGTVAFSADQSMGNNRLTDLPLPAMLTDAVNAQYVDSSIDGSSVRTVEVEHHTLVAQDLTNKYVTLGFPVSAVNEVSLAIATGPQQIAGTDFEIDNINTDRLTWDSLGLDGLLEAGDTLVVVYPRLSYVTRPDLSSGVSRTLFSIPTFLMALDDVKIGIEPVTFLDIYDSYAMSSSVDGGLMFTLPIDNRFTFNNDVIFDLVYGIPSAPSGGDTVTLKAELWVTPIGSTASFATPDYTYTEVIALSGGDENKVLKHTTAQIKIPAGVVNASGAQVSIRLYRDTGAGSNYGSTFHVVAMTLKQNVI